MVATHNPVSAERRTKAKTRRFRGTMGRHVAAGCSNTVIVLACTSSPKILNSGGNGRSKSRGLENDGVPPTTAFCAVNILKRTVLK